MTPTGLPWPGSTNGLKENHSRKSSKSFVQKSVWHAADPPHMLEQLLFRFNQLDGDEDVGFEQAALDGIVGEEGGFAV